MPAHCSRTPGRGEGLRGVLEVGGASLANPEVGRSLLCRQSSGVSRIESSSPKRPPFRLTPSGSPAAPQPRAARAGKAHSPGVQAQAPLAPAPCAVPPHPDFATCSERGGLQRPHQQAANFVPSSAGAILAKFVRPNPLPTCAGDAPARAAQALGPRGAARSPGRTGEFATVAAARAPRRPRGASASPLGGRGLGAPGRGRARGPRLPAVAPDHYRRPARALRGRSARSLRRGAGDN